MYGKVANYIFMLITGYFSITAKISYRRILDRRILSAQGRLGNILLQSAQSFPHHLGQRVRGGIYLVQLVDSPFKSVAEQLGQACLSTVGRYAFHGKACSANCGDILGNVLR